MGRSGERKCSQVLTTVQGRHSGEVSGAESRLPPAEAGTPSDADRQPAVRSGQTKGAGGLSGQTRSDLLRLGQTRSDGAEMLYE
jgi:hypothetical protein